MTRPGGGWGVPLVSSVATPLHRTGEYLSRRIGAAADTCSIYYRARQYVTSKQIQYFLIDNR